MALQLTGAFKRDALREPAGAAAGGRHRRRPDGHRHGDRADGVLPAAGREDPRRATRRSCAELGEPRVRARVRRRGAASCSTSSSRTAARCAPSARAPRRPASRRTSSRWCARWGGVSLVYRKRHGRLARLPAEPRGGHQGARGGHRLRREHQSRWRPSPTSSGTSQAVRFQRAGRRERQVARSDASSRCRRARCSSPPARRPNITYEKECPGTFQLDAKQKFFQPHGVVPDGDGTFHLERRCRTGSSRRTNATASSSPTTATTTRATPATSSRRWRRRRTATRTSSQLFAEELAALDPAAQPARGRGVAAPVASGSTTSFSAVVEDVVRLTPTIVEVDRQGAGGRAALPARPVLPPAELRDGGARASRSTARRAARCSMEGIALTGAWVDKERGLLSLIALEMGVSSRLCAYLQARRAGAS